MDEDKWQMVFDILLDLSSDSIVLHSSGKITYVNNTAVNTFKAKSPTELIGREILDFVHKDYTEAVNDRLERQKAGEKVDEWTQRKLIALDGSIIEFKLSSQLIKLSDSDFTLVVLRDVTAEVAMQKEIYLSELKYTTIVASSPDPVIIIRGNQILFSNPKSQDLFEIEDQQDLLNHDYLDYVHPDDHTKTMDYFRGMLNLENKSQIMEIRILTKLKKVKYVEMTRAIIFYENAPADLVFLRDRTQLVKTQRRFEEEEFRYRRIFNESTDANFITNVEGRIVDANKAFLTLFGYDRREIFEIHIKKLFANPELRTKLQEILEKDKVFTNLEIKFVHKSGREILCLLTAHASYDSATDETQFHGMVKDITAVRSTEMAMLASQKLESLGLIASGISHRFNNLLMGIISSHSLAVKLVPKDGELATLLSIIEESSKKAVLMVNQLLEYSGEAKVDKNKENLTELIKNMSQLIKLMVPSTITLDFEYFEISGSINIDKKQIKQVILNLIRNSVEAISEQDEKIGVIHIETKAEVISKEDKRMDRSTMFTIPPGHYALIRLTDDGIGMDPVLLAQIFDPFFSTKFVGRGLGLASVKGILRSNDAYIEIETKLGKGTEFVIYFPLIKPLLKRAKKIKD